MVSEYYVKVLLHICNLCLNLIVSKKDPMMHYLSHNKFLIILYFEKNQ